MQHVDSELLTRYDLRRETDELAEDVSGPVVASDPLTSVDPTQAQVLGRYLALQRHEDVPEIQLWLVAGHVDLNARCEELLAGGDAPYWAFCWGGGAALARYVLDHPELVRGKRVVDFGAGSGVLAIAAALAGAAQITAVDSDPRALRIAALNARANGVRIAVSERVPESRDLLLAADVLYDDRAARWLLDGDGLRSERWLSDAHRAGSRRPPCEPICSVPVRAFPDVDYPVCTAFIYRLSAAPHP